MFQIFVVILLIIIAAPFILKIKIVVIMEEELYIEAYILNIKVRRYRFNEKQLKKMQQTGENVAKEEVSNYIKQIEFTDAKLFFKNIREILAKVQFQQIDFRLNINVDDYILNAYIVTFLNTVISMLISKNIKKINNDNLNYEITSNETKTKLYLKCIMYDRMTNIIIVLIRAIKYAKELKKRGNDENGKGTSNRKFNGNSNVITRING